MALWVHHSKQDDLLPSTLQRNVALFFRICGERKRPGRLTIRSWGRDLRWVWPRDGKRETLEGAGIWRGGRSRLDGHTPPHENRQAESLQRGFGLVGRVSTLPSYRRQGCEGGGRSPMRRQVRPDVFALRLNAILCRQMAPRNSIPGSSLCLTR